MKKISTLLVAAVMAASMVGCGTATDEGTPVETTEPVVEVEATPEAIEETASAVGEWHLVKVSSQATEDSDILELDPEENQSFYAEADGSFTLNEDGTGTRTVIDGEDTVATELTWTADGDVYTVVEEDGSTDYIYDADADVLCRKVQDTEGDLGEITFVYSRVDAVDADVVDATETEVEPAVVEAENAEVEAEPAESTETEAKAE